MYAGTKNKFYQVYFISSRNSNLVHPREHIRAAFIMMIHSVHKVCTDNQRPEEVVNNNGYTTKKKGSKDIIIRYVTRGKRFK
jgi:hypothetical protein